MTLAPGAVVTISGHRRVSVDQPGRAHVLDPVRHRTEIAEAHNCALAVRRR